MSHRYRFPASLATLVAASAMFVGCAETNTVERVNAPANGVAREPMRHIITDEVLSWQAEPVDLILGKAEDGESLKVQLRLKNDKWFGRRLEVNYYVDWFDASGMRVAGYKPAMHRLSINASEIVPLVAVAPTPKAVDFKFIFIDAK
ncbi:MAG: YcfL family protein [Puniceicoccales bacterium]|nr:YcfL family protein [Puniceicoccales bacterium]